MISRIDEAAAEKSQMPDLLTLSAATEGPFTTANLRTHWNAFDPSSFKKDDLLAERFLLAKSGEYCVYFSPLGEVPEATARVVFVGLTPGLTQITIAAQLRQRAYSTNGIDERAFANLIRSQVSYAGSMRKNAVAMLNDIGLHNALQIGSSEELFSAESMLCATTSALVYPVFAAADRKNFSGSNDLSNNELFRKMLIELLAPRLRAAPLALIIPFGKAAASGVQFLIDSGSVPANHVLRGFPHPSGLNGHRVSQFSNNRISLTQQIERWFTGIDEMYC